MPTSVLDELLHEPLEDVGFTRERIAFGFDQARLTFFRPPTVKVGGSTFELGHPGFRDALCSFIDHEVSGVEESPERGLVVHFANGAVIVGSGPSDGAEPLICRLKIYDRFVVVTRSVEWVRRDGAVSRHVIDLL